MRWLVKFFDWMDYSTSNLTAFRYGKWRVRYPDGKYTTKLYYDEASDLKEIFGGEIIYVRYNDPCGSGH